MRSKAAATAKQMRTGRDEAVIGRGYKGARRLTPPGGRRGLPMYDLRCTIYDLNASARGADFFGSLTHEEWVE